MRILLTNDDGINARGLDLLETVARRFSDDIWVVAPTEEQSGAGHSLTLTQPVRVRRHDNRRFSVTGTPTDAVMMALAHIMKDSPPDLILSGSSTLTSTLLEHGIADEVVLVVYPVLLGTGKRFFAEGTPPRSFELVSTKAMPSGIILSAYKVAGPLMTG